MRIAKEATFVRLSARPSLLMLVLATLLVGVTPPAQAGSPRFVAGRGPGWNIPAWNTVAWFTNTISYFTDPGALSPNVTHAQADAMVAAAAAVWNVPTSSVTLAQGGTLAEDVNTSNSYFDGTEVVFPADVQVANESAVPVAILYDMDGSLVDLLLGAGASDPDGCEQNAVIGDVDDIHQSNGAIAHATLILNGRCVGSVPEQMLQMQYQLARAFGRVLGLSWSQTNDNVFTAQAPVTANQLAFWPLMHPIDVICGNYSYQCMTNPFTLRVDDLNTLAQLYPIYQNAVPTGKQGTSNDALYMRGLLQFPTGQGMEWVNITARRRNQGFAEDWQTTSAMSGFEYQQAITTPLSDTAAVDSGWPNAGMDAYFVFRRVPLDGSSDVTFTAEAINPLYMGDAAIGPYLRLPVTPSGSPDLFTDWSALPNGDGPVNAFPVPAGAAASCNPGADGTEVSPASIDPSGWQAGQLCAWGHNSWWNVPVAAGHTWSFEVTATDETGAASMSKAMPVLGAWAANDPTGTTPTVAEQAVAFNAMSYGMTQMAMDAPANDSVYRISISDQFGAGRPDFTYTARVLYADHASPATVGTAGGQITITGTGFRPGNQVWINGVQAPVLSTSATQLLAAVPPMIVTGGSVGVPLDIAVIDPETAGSASIPAAVSYVVLPDVLQSVSVPSRLETGVLSPAPFMVRVLASDGQTPVAGALVTLTATAATARLVVCGGQPSCTVTTDGNGLVQTDVAGVEAGAAVLTAAETQGSAELRVDLSVVAPARAVWLERAAHYVAAGVADTWTLQLAALQDGLGAANVPVQWSATPLLQLAAAEPVTDGSGFATVSVSAAALGSGDVEVVTACVWSGLCATSTIHAVDPAQWALTVPVTAAQSVPASASLAGFAVSVTDGAGHPLENAPVRVYQRVMGWEGVCADASRCPAAPVLASSETLLHSDENGSVQVSPLEVAGVPQTVEVAIVTGSQAFATLTLVKAP